MKKFHQAFIFSSLGIFFLATVFFMPSFVQAAWRCTTDTSVSAATSPECEAQCVGLCGAYQCNRSYYSGIANCRQACPNTECNLVTDFPATAIVDPALTTNPRTAPTNGSVPPAVSGNTQASRFRGFYPQPFAPGPGSAPIDSVGGVLGILLSAVELAQVVFWILLVGFGLYAAYLYLFAVGNKESVATARRVFVYALVAGILAIVSYGIPGIVNGFVFGF